MLYQLAADAAAHSAGPSTWDVDDWLRLVVGIIASIATVLVPALVLLVRAVKAENKKTRHDLRGPLHDASVNAARTAMAVEEIERRVNGEGAGLVKQVADEVRQSERHLPADQVRGLIKEAVGEAYAKATAEAMRLAAEVAARETQRIMLAAETLRLSREAEAKNAAAVGGMAGDVADIKETTERIEGKVDERAGSANADVH